MKRPILAVMFMLILSGSLFCGLAANSVEAYANSTTYIRADGTVERTDKIERAGNLYTFTSDVAGSIIVEMDNITIEGAQFTLSANGGYGIRLYQRRNVTVRNLVVKDTYRAFDLTYADNNTLVGNTIINSGSAFYFWFSRNNLVSKNILSNVSYAFDFLTSPNYGAEGNIIAGNVILSAGIGVNLMESHNIFCDNIINSSIVGVTVSGHQNLFRNNTINCSGICFKDSSFDNDVRRFKHG